MAKIEWAMWANEQALISCFILTIGSIVGLCSLLEEFPHIRWQISIYSLIISALIFLVEYPRGKRAKGTDRPRPFQKYASNIVSCLGGIGSNYFGRFVLYSVLSVPSLLNLATLMGGLCFVITALIYLKAAMENESWSPCIEKSDKNRTLTRPAPPVLAPPRAINSRNQPSPSYENVLISN